jgi:hypothetical protein
MLSKEEIRKVIEGSLAGKIGPTGMKLSRAKLDALLAQVPELPTKGREWDAINRANELHKLEMTPERRAQRDAARRELRQEVTRLKLCSLDQHCPQTNPSDSDPTES